MIRFYYSLAPNPMKVALLLEEVGLPYEPVPVDARKGEQHAPDFLALNPNGKLPVIVDGETTIFDSSAILLYLADKTGRFAVGPDDPRRGEALSWLMFIASGIGPYCGQYVHFRHHAPEPIDYALNRYHFEADRHWRIVDERLGSRRYMLGDDYTFVDMALWGWMRGLPNIFGADAIPYPHVKRLMDEIGARPAAVRATALKDRHAFKTEMDDEAKRNMFRHTIAA